jgi:exodeoxyribonuclease VII large subunit
MLNRVIGLRSRILHPRQRLQDMRMRVDDYSIRLLSSITSSLARRNERLAFQRNMLMQVSPARTVASMQDQVNILHQATIRQINRLLREGQTAMNKNASMLDALNPMAILQRGYSITRTLPDRSVVSGANQVNIDQNLEILLRRGRLTVTVDDIENQVD